MGAGGVQKLAGCGGGTGWGSGSRCGLLRLCWHNAYGFAGCSNFYPGVAGAGSFVEGVDRAALHRTRSTQCVALVGGGAYCGGGTSRHASRRAWPGRFFGVVVGFDGLVKGVGRPTQY